MENGEFREMAEISTILLDQQSKLWLADPLPLRGPSLADFDFKIYGSLA